MIRLTKSHNHDHFWVESGKLYESYSTLRGLRYRFIANVALPDTERLPESVIESLEIASPKDTTDGH